MKITKFEGIGKGLIKIYFGDRVIQILGELTMTPIFYAYASSIKNWDSPDEKEIIDDNLKSKIIKSIEDYTKNTKVKVIFE